MGTSPLPKNSIFTVKKPSSYPPNTLFGPASIGQVLTSSNNTPQWVSGSSSGSVMSNTLPPNPPANFTVSYEHLTARQCEKLKDDVIEKIEKDRNYYKWKTYGARRDEELTEYPISDLSNQHLENILITQPQIDNELAAAILMTLKNRYGVL